MNKASWCFAGVIFLIVGCCQTPEWVLLVHKNDYSMVMPDKYQATSYPLDTVPEKVIKVGKEIETLLNEQEVGNKIIHYFHPEESETVSFKYMYTAIDDNKNEILHFVAPFKFPGRFAGYQLEFIFENDKISKLYLFKIPNY